VLVIVTFSSSNLILQVIYNGQELLEEQIVMYALSIQQTSDGGYIVAGILIVLVLVSDALIIKLNSSGNIQWSRAIGGTNVDDSLLHSTNIRWRIYSCWMRLIVLVLVIMTFSSSNLILQVIYNGQELLEEQIMISLLHSTNIRWRIYSCWRYW
jgi:hypothetical protein